MIFTKRSEPIILEYENGVREEGYELKVIVDDFFLKQLSESLGQQVTNDNLHHAFQIWLDHTIGIASCNEENIEDY
ncbi:hypothetical protein GCM10007416_31380 [Kroppenstedtia guangzhouensis]|uniref:Uncharacterized protein n=1 Tax=Kroppenstedtia guangzhouensis TaxID=1274356 RepID=A0ABQ1H2Y9_9BACL|nr:hypothetical protein [Kroppenstedtia guangzhouensis]GGA55918.1 hypothetical protein GCM10007416_31380 [Kroppenstedtia guangzhouensis]